MGVNKNKPTRQGGNNMEKKNIKQELKKELKKTLRDFENMRADVEELYEMLIKIEANWKELTKEEK